MKKVILLCATFFLLPVYAAYTLTSEDQKLVNSFTQKAQQKPLRYQETVIAALKNAQLTITDERKIALFQAIESNLRKKFQGYVLATRVEREEIVDALTKDTDQMTGSVEIGLSGKLTSTTEPYAVTFDTQFLMDVDAQDISNPKVRLQFDGSGSADTESASATAEMRVVDNNFFILLSKLNIVSSSGIDISSYIKPYIGTWYTTSLDNDFEMNSSVQINGDELSLEEEKALLNTLLYTNFIPNLRYLGQAEGFSTYSGFVDNKALITVIKNIALQKGEVLPSQDIAELEKMLKNVTFFITFSVNKE